MRIVFDLQACQSGSRYRGIGRGSRSLMLAMANELTQRGHDVVFLLNDAFAETIDGLRKDVRTNAPLARVSCFSVISPCAAGVPELEWRQMAARMLREHAIACLRPDFVHVPALLADGWGDDSVGSVGVLGVHVPTSLTQHDLIPLVMADIYMPEGPFRDYYMAKLEGVKQADLFLAISEYSREEAIEWLGLAPEDVVHISSAADGDFSADVEGSAIDETLRKHGLDRGFLLYAPGGFDPRKNIDRLLEAYSRLPAGLRGRHKLVLASKIDEATRAGIIWKAGTLGVSASEVVLTDYVPDDELLHMYHACHVYLFPSLHEGFGLPALEAMMCGAPVIASSTTSIPEVIGMDEALFDPYNVESMTAKILQSVQDEDFRQRLIEHAAVQPHKFSWEASGRVAVDALEQKHAALNNEGWVAAPVELLPTAEQMLARLTLLAPRLTPSVEDVEAFHACYEANLRAVPA